MKILKLIRQLLFRKKNILPVAPLNARSLGSCMIFAGCDLPSLDNSYFKLEVNDDDLKKFKTLPQNIEPVAIFIRVYSTSFTVIAIF